MNDFKTQFEDILDDLKGRFRNPLILSFILVWCFMHWELIYMIFNFKENTNFQTKTLFVKYYTINETYLGMLLFPLLYSFISLSAFYVIGVLAQFIKVWLGKRLSAAMLAKFDKGSFESKIEFNKERKKAKALKALLEVTNTQLDNLTEENATIKSELERLESDKRGLERRISEEVRNSEYSKDFVDKTEKTILLLMAYKSGYGKLLRNNRTELENQFHLLNGSWKILSTDQIDDRRSGGVLELQFNEKIIKTFKGESFGNVENLKFHGSLNCISFHVNNGHDSKSYYLLRINKDKMIGITEDHFVTFDRVIAE